MIRGAAAATTSLRCLLLGDCWGFLSLRRRPHRSRGRVPVEERRSEQWLSSRNALVEHRSPQRGRDHQAACPGCSLFPISSLQQKLNKRISERTIETVVADTLRKSHSYCEMIFCLHIHPGSRWSFRFLRMVDWGRSRDRSRTPVKKLLFGNNILLFGSRFQPPGFLQLTICRPQIGPREAGWGEGGGDWGARIGRSAYIRNTDEYGESGSMKRTS